jgi:hypothetical protein
MQDFASDDSEFGDFFKGIVSLLIIFSGKNLPRIFFKKTLDFAQTI